MKKQLIAGLISAAALVFPTLIPLQASAQVFFPPYGRDFRHYDRDWYVVFCRNPYYRTFYQAGTFRTRRQAEWVEKSHERWGARCSIERYG